MPRFEDTTDIVLTGSYSELDGPNADGLLWFDRSVRPLIPDLPGLRYVVAGSKAGDFVRSVTLDYGYTIASDPPDMAEIYRSARLMVAPTRFAAGSPMKVHEAAAHGVPVVVTSLLAHQLGWKNDVSNAPYPNPGDLAGAIADLALQRGAWEKAQSRQRKLVARDCSPEKFQDNIVSICSGHPMSPGHRSSVAAE
jgi:glycosyltransferase involved in cell wall biosynthesis